MTKIIKEPGPALPGKYNIVKNIRKSEMLNVLPISLKILNRNIGVAVNFALKSWTNGELLCGESEVSVAEWGKLMNILSDPKKQGSSS